MKTFPAFLIALSVLLCARTMAADPALRLQCTPSLIGLAKDLVRPLREQGIEIRLVEEAGNTQVVGALGAGNIDVALDQPFPETGRAGELSRPAFLGDHARHACRHGSGRADGLGKRRACAQARADPRLLREQDAQLERGRRRRSPDDFFRSRS
ncbi:MAG: hypothetical protein WDN28_02555 [Chthoniobacter sp.]